MSIHPATQQTRRESASFDLVSDTLSIGPHAGALRVAARAGLSMLVPLTILALSGHLAWAAWSARSPGND